jgi:Methyltransferase domain
VSVSIVIVMESLYDLVRMARHDEAAARRFPGLDYLGVLAAIHRTLCPATYLEIGVLWGESLRLALPETRALGIDPDPRADDPRVYRMTSRDFFATHNPQAILQGPIEFAFIDGEHLFEEALADFAAIERHAAPNALIAIHDTIPLNAETASRHRTTEFYSGDVWKLPLYLRLRRPDLHIVTLATAPTGLTLVFRAPIEPRPSGSGGYFASHPSKTSSSENGAT